MIWNICSTVFSNPQIHYDDTFNSDTSDVTTYINSMVTHLQAHFCQISLGTQIQVEVSILWYLLELFLPIWYPTDFYKNYQRFARSTRICVANAQHHWYNNRPCKCYSPNKIGVICYFSFNSRAKMCHIYTCNFIQAIDGYTYESGQSWTAESDSGSLSGPIKDITAASNSNADLHVFLCKDPQFYGMYQ